MSVSLRDGAPSSLLEYASMDEPAWNPDSGFPGGSLLAMLEFYAARFIDTVQTLERVAKAYSELTPGTIFTQEFLAKHPLLREDLQEMRSNAEEIGLTHSVKEVDTILWEVDHDCTASRLSELLRSLSRRIRDELADCMIFMVPRARANHYEQDEPLDGSGIVDKLPDVMDDAVEAGNCFALGRYTACVFHLMRVMEASVKALASSLGAPAVDNKSWGPVINAIRGAVKSRYQDEHDPIRQQYEAILSHLESVKLAWRNPTMHVKSRYDDEQAKKIMEAVRIFTDDLADVL